MHVVGPDQPCSEDDAVVKIGLDSPPAELSEGVSIGRCASRRGGSSRLLSFDPRKQLTQGPTRSNHLGPTRSDHTKYRCRCILDAPVPPSLNYGIHYTVITTVSRVKTFRNRGGGERHVLFQLCSGNSSPPPRNGSLSFPFQYKSETSRDAPFLSSQFE